MASQHELRITATLDTSQLNQQLDALNARRASAQDDTTGNNISIGMRMKQLQLSLDTLNRTLQSIDKFNRSGGGGQSYDGRYNDIGNRLAPFMDDKNRRTSIQTLPQRAALARAMMSNAWGAGFNGDLYWRKGGAFREALMNIPENQSLAAQYRALQQKSRQDKALYEENQKLYDIRRQRMGLATGGHFAGMIGQSLQDAGYEQLGAGFNVIGNTLGASASGAMVGGPWGAAIGGIIGLATSLTAEMGKLRDAADKAAEALYSVQRKEATSYIEYRRDMKMDALSRAVDASLKKPEDLANYQRQIEESRTAAQYELFNAKQLYEKFHLDATSPNPSATVEQRTALQEKALEHLKEVQSAQSALDNWDSLAKKVKDAFQAMVDETNRNHEEGLRLQKMEEDFRFQLLEEEKRNEETRKNILMQREYVLLQLEQDYMQQGVDILSSMGKQGKFMSNMESQSINQERYSPITKKLDTMQKSLDHLSQIDAKLRNLNTGLL